MWKLIPTLVTMTWIAGCASYRAPEGADVATLRVAVRILGVLRIDDATTCSVLEDGGVREVKLSPGKHIVRAVVLMGAYSAEVDLWLVAAPRGDYQLHYRRDGMRVAFWIIDKATGRPVGGVKGSDDEPPDSVDRPKDRERSSTFRKSVV